MAVTYKTSIVQDSMVGYWDARNIKSYPRAGSIWYDIGGRTSNNGTFTNSPTYSTNGGGTIIFNGASQYINVPTSTSLDPNSGSFTIQTWCKITGVSSSTWHLLVARRSTGGTGGYYLGINDANGGNFMLTNNAGARTDTSSAGWTSFTYNTWFMLTAILNRGTNSQTIIKNNYESSFTTTPSGGVYQNTSVCSLGGDLGSNSYWVNGELPVVMMYNKALSAAEIAKNFNAFRGRYGV
jgi:hypothetical protein